MKFLLLILKIVKKTINKVMRKIINEQTKSKAT